MPSNVVEWQAIKIDNGISFITFPSRGGLKSRFVCLHWLQNFNSLHGASANTTFRLKYLHRTCAHYDGSTTAEKQQKRLNYRRVIAVLIKFTIMAIFAWIHKKAQRELARERKKERKVILSTFLDCSHGIFHELYEKKK